MYVHAHQHHTQQQQQQTVLVQLLILQEKLDLLVTKYRSGNIQLANPQYFIIENK